jgi:hypothetical protein
MRLDRLLHEQHLRMLDALEKQWRQDPRDDPESEWYDPRHIYYTDEDIKNATS